MLFKVRANRAQISGYSGDLLGRIESAADKKNFLELVLAAELQREVNLMVVVAVLRGYGTGGRVCFWSRTCFLLISA
jgi:hypothetical protein